MKKIVGYILKVVLTIGSILSMYGVYLLIDDKYWHRRWLENGSPKLKDDSPAGVRNWLKEQKNEIA